MPWGLGLASAVVADYIVGNRGGLIVARSSAPLPNGIIAFVKRDCPTCELVAPVLRQLAVDGALTVYSQDDPDLMRRSAAGHFQLGNQPTERERGRHPYTQLNANHPKVQIRPKNEEVFFSLNCRR